MNKYLIERRRCARPLEHSIFGGDLADATHHHHDVMTGTRDHYPVGGKRHARRAAHRQAVQGTARRPGTRSSPPPGPAMASNHRQPAVLNPVRTTPAGITKRVGSSCWTPIAGTALRRARPLYLCRRCPWPLPAASQTFSAQWSRPVRIDVCSMFARMLRYRLAAPGIRSAARMPTTGQNSSSRHGLAKLTISSSRKYKQSSGLLICGHIGPVTGSPVISMTTTCASVPAVR